MEVNPYSKATAGGVGSQCTLYCIVGAHKQGTITQNFCGLTFYFYLIKY